MAYHYHHQEELMFILTLSKDGYEIYQILLKRYVRDLGS